MDKIAAEPLVGKDVSGKGVQKGLLRLVEGIENTLELGRERILLSTKHVLFIAGGAFDKMESTVRSRLSKYGIEGDWQDNLLTEDLVAHGMERQLMGRFPVRVVYDALTTQDLQNILTKSEDSPLKAYVNDLKAWDINLTVTDEALKEVARRAKKEKTGARGLISILHRLLFEDLYGLPGAHTGDLVVDRHYVQERLP